jgi:hypothetical protein
LHRGARSPDGVLCILQNIIRSYRQAGLLAVQKLRELSVDIGTDDKARQRDMMVKCAMTSMNSKLVRFSTLKVQGGHSCKTSVFKMFRALLPQRLAPDE